MMKCLKGLTIFLVLMFGTLNAFAQTTAFSYQGRLSEAGAPVTGNRLFQFTLFDENGAVIPGAVINQTLTVTNGVFNTNLDFGAAAFPGANRSLEIAVKINVGDAFTILNPRQAILAAPYSTKSKTADAAINSSQLGGVDATRFIKSDTGGNVSLNGNLTVSGSTTFDTVNAATQFNLGGQRVLSADNSGNLLVGTNSGDVPTPKSSFSGFGKSSVNTSTGLYNTFLGGFAGYNNTTGSRNTFVGHSTGYRNTTGNFNSFFGVTAGASNTTGSENAFFGDSTGSINTTGEQNVFIGTQAGSNNTTGNRNTITGFNSGGGCFTFPCPFALTGSDNAFYGYASGLKGTTGTRNSFFGGNSGMNNSTGNDNSFFGHFAGQANTTGAGNSFIGESAGLANSQGSFNSFVGESAGRSNTTGNQNAFFGNSAGRGNTTGIFNVFLGTNAGYSNTIGSNNSFVGRNAGLNTDNADFNAFFGNYAGLSNTTGFQNTFLGSNAGNINTTGNNNTTIGSAANVGANNLTNATAIGANALVSQSNSVILGNNANVGIGTSAPNSKLTVVGLIETTTGGVKFPDGTIQTTAGGGSGVTSLNGLTNNLTLAAGSNITITPSGNTLTIASTGGGSGGILNQTTTQAGANFNISGNGTASAFFANFVAANDYRNASGDTSILNSIGGVLRVGLDSGSGAGGNQNTFVGNNSGDNAGTSDNNTFAGYQSGRLTNGATGGNSFFGAFTGGGTQGGFNSFFGVRSGGQTTTGSSNSFFGADSGLNNTTGINNAFFGADAGKSNQNGNYNSFFGFKAGESNIGGSSLLNGANNAFFGTFAGQTNSNGQNNVFVGFQAGKTNSNGSENTFVGVNAGITNGGENRNTFIGANADGDAAITNSTAIGSRAKVTTSNSLVLGSVSGENGAAFDTQVGIGTIAPKARLDVTGGNILVGSPGQGMILKSPDGATCKLLSIDNAGVMVLTAVACP